MRKNGGNKENRDYQGSESDDKYRNRRSDPEWNRYRKHGFEHLWHEKHGTFTNRTSGPCIEPFRPKKTIVCDFVIVGAGPGGLESAFVLGRAMKSSGYKKSICVFEKKDKIGGNVTPFNITAPQNYDGNKHCATIPQFLLTFIIYVLCDSTA